MQIWTLPFVPLVGEDVALEPWSSVDKEELRTLVDSDPGAWSIMPSDPTGPKFDDYWASACGASADERLVYAIRRAGDGAVVGTSTFYTAALGDGGAEVGRTFLRPDARAGISNPAAKLLMLDHAFGAGLLRVQFRVDTRNARSQAAVAKLGATFEGTLRRDRQTWTGHVRDTNYYSILSDEWPDARRRLVERLRRLRDT